MFRSSLADSSIRRISVSGVLSTWGEFAPAREAGELDALSGFGPWNKDRKVGFLGGRSGGRGGASSCDGGGKDGGLGGSIWLVTRLSEEDKAPSSTPRVAEVRELEEKQRLH